MRCVKFVFRNMALKFFYIFLRQKVYLIQLLINDQPTVLLLVTTAAKTVFFCFRKTTYFFTIVSPLVMEINDS